ncbi:MAG: sulfurtransferase [Chloroflexi bacterium]|nr:sulfurtransferase [Chloroflexota bacterium]
MPPDDRDHYLATTDWLAAHLGDPGLRVLECTVFLRPRDDGKPGYAVVSGREDWAAGHVPGSVFADIPGDLSDHAQALRFMMPPSAQFAAAMGRYGVGDGSQVVLYDRAGNMWAARVWWMLRAFGFTNARLLDGGWTKWAGEQRPIATDAAPPAPAVFTARPRPGLIATKEDVLEAMAAGQSCLVNALSPAQHRGDVAPYGRPGHIRGSVNVPAMGAAGVVDPDTQTYLGTTEIRRRFEAAGVRPGDRMITYCGGGIAASSAAFAAIMAGFGDVAVYDASLSEWAADPSLPMETSPRA